MPFRIYKWCFVNVGFKKTGRFIDLETYIKEQDDEAFTKATVTRLLPWMKISDKVKAFAVAWYMLEAQELKENYPWIFNPPKFPSTGEITQGSMERDKFVQDYGAYMEMVYICCKQDPMKSDIIFKWNTKKFLFWSEYLLRKRTVENLK